MERDRSLVVSALLEEIAPLVVDLLVDAAAREGIPSDDVALTPGIEPLEIQYAFRAFAGRYRFVQRGADQFTAELIRPHRVQGPAAGGPLARRLSKGFRSMAQRMSLLLVEAAVQAVARAGLDARWLIDKEVVGGEYGIRVEYGRIRSAFVHRPARIVGDLSSETSSTNLREMGETEVRSGQPITLSEGRRTEEIAFVELEEYCAAYRGLVWDDREWLERVARAAWRQAHALRRYTAPPDHVCFPFEAAFQDSTGVQSLNFLLDGPVCVTIRVDLIQSRYALLVVDRRQHPDLSQWPLLGILVATSVALYRDCVVADSPLREGAPLAPVLSPHDEEPKVRPVAQSLGSHRDTSYVVPRTYRPDRTQAHEDEPGPTWLGAHGVVGHIRRLHSGWNASDEQIAAAMTFGMLLGPDETFVRPHVRGARPDGQIPERQARSRNLTPNLLGMLAHAARWS